MTKKQLEDRVADLERRVQELEAQPREQHTHFHSHVGYVQQPYVQPTIPLPLAPYYEPYKITCGDYGITNAAGAVPWGTSTCGGIQ